MLIKLANAKLVPKQFSGSHKAMLFRSLYYTTAVNWQEIIPKK
jgi:hypothetical protein